MTNLLNLIEAISKGMLDPEGLAATREKALNTEIGDSVVDTVPAFDTGVWETGIAPHGEPWIIVEQYDDEAAARVGHYKWVDAVENDPDQKFKDIDIFGIGV